MKQITIRRIDDSWVEHARMEARRRGVSMNKIFVDALGVGLGVQPGKKTNGLEQFSGKMPFLNEEEKEAWDKSMEHFDQIDQDLWK